MDRSYQADLDAVSDHWRYKLDRFAQFGIVPTRDAALTAWLIGDRQAAMMLAGSDGVSPGDFVAVETFLRYQLPEEAWGHQMAVEAWERLGGFDGCRKKTG